MRPLLALLVAGSLRLAHHAAIDSGWQPIAQSRYLTPEGEEVQAVADRSSGLMGRTTGTRIYLGRYWSDRADAGDVQRLLDEGRLVAAVLPA